MQIHYIGSLHNMATTATNVMYEIGDGTGYIETRQWLDSEADEQGKTAGIGQDKYVSVIGTLKKFNDKLHVSAQQIRPVENPDEVYNHLLKALAVSLSYRNPATNGVSLASVECDHSADIFSSTCFSKLSCTFFRYPCPNDIDNPGSRWCWWCRVCERLRRARRRRRQRVRVRRPASSRAQDHGDHRGCRRRRWSARFDGLEAVWR